MVSTSGSQLLPQSAVKALSAYLLPRTTLLTPNIPEATLLLKENGLAVPDISSVDNMEAMGRELQKLGPKWVLVKGGHIPLTENLTVADASTENRFVVDVLVGPEEQVVKIQAPWQDSTSTHGTGCSLACKSLTCNLSQYHLLIVLTCYQLPSLLTYPTKWTFRAPLGLPVATSKPVSKPRLELARATGLLTTSIPFRHFLLLR